METGSALKLSLLSTKGFEEPCEIHRYVHHDFSNGKHYQASAALRPPILDTVASRLPDACRYMGRVRMLLGKASLLTMKIRKVKRRDGRIA